MLASSCGMPLSSVSSGELLLLPSVNRLCLTSTQGEDSSGGAEKSEVDMVSLYQNLQIITIFFVACM